MKKNILYIGFFSMVMISASNAQNTKISAKEATNNAVHAANIVKEETTKIKALAKAAGSDVQAKEALKPQVIKAATTAAIAYNKALDMAKQANTPEAKKAANQAKEDLKELVPSERKAMAPQFNLGGIGGTIGQIGGGIFGGAIKGILGSFGVNF